MKGDDRISLQEAKETPEWEKFKNGKRGVMMERSQLYPHNSDRKVWEGGNS